MTSTHRGKMDCFKGCMLGGAVGDALGAPIEFMSLGQIRTSFGADGISGYAPAYGRQGAITDDTQMSLFTAEGLILSRLRDTYRQAPGVSLAVYHAYLRWLSTQEPSHQARLIKAFGTCSMLDGQLMALQELHSQRAPGRSCLSALGSGRMGTMASPVNQSKGCGGVMRVAPVGLAFKAIDQAFQIGCECAAITHGHPSGFLASGVLAAMICSIVSGAPVWNAVHDAISLLKERPHHEECLQALEQAIDLSHKAEPSPDKVETIGAGWVAEEALAIGVYCALTTPHDFGKGVLLAVNHSGDSDSTGAIAGNIIGAAMGVGAIPDEWLAHLELAQEIEETAVDLYHGFSRNDPDPV